MFVVTKINMDPSECYENPKMSFVIDQYSDTMSVRTPTLSISGPLDNIYQITQCLDQDGPLPSEEPADRPPTAIPSSVVWQSEDLDHFLDVSWPPLADSICLPIDAEVTNLISFDETLVVSRLDDEIEPIDKRWVLYIWH